MAKYASALVQLGFSLDRIGFIFRFYLEAAPFVLRTLLRDELDLFDDELRNWLFAVNLTSNERTSNKIFKIWGAIERERGANAKNFLAIM